jgi:protein SCO1/2
LHRIDSGRRPVPETEGCDLTRFEKLLMGFSRYVSGAAFAAFALSLLFSWSVFIAVMLFLPASSSGLGAFAEEFRVWCFGYDPATGSTEIAYVMAMLLPQVMLAGFILGFWWAPLREMSRRPRAFVPYVATAATLVTVAGVGFAYSGVEAPTGELPFPAEALRTAFAPPELVLTNQLEQTVDLAALRGKVVVLTAVYASCPHTCPAILSQAKAAIAELDPAAREELRLVAVTLDPENDSPQVLAGLAQMHGLDAPLWNLVTGESVEVEGTLDRMQMARERDPETGVINHANLFLLIDRDGRLAYRLGLGERQQRWLVSALRVLLREET